MRINEGEILIGIRAGNKLSNQPYENTATCQSLLRHTRADFFRPAAAATSRHVASQTAGLESRGQSGQSSRGTPHRPGNDDEPRCSRDFASSRHDTGHGRNVADDDNRERFSGGKRQSIGRRNARERDRQEFLCR